MTGLKNALERFRGRIESAARGEAFTPFFSIESALLLLSIVYGGLMRIRARLYEREILPAKTLPCRVVSIGNIIAGGTGKTPMTILVARCINDLGYRVVVISRGYRGRMEDTGGIVSDGQTIYKGPDDAGDEPYLMARVLRGIPVIVGRRRFDAGMLAVEHFTPDVIVLDDAFQHLQLKRDLDLVLLDSRAPFANGHVLPRGVLREPISALHRAHAIIFTRCSQTIAPSALEALPAGRPVFYTVHTPVLRRTEQGVNTFFTDSMDLSILKGKKAVAFAGLADNDQFFDSLEPAGCLLVHTVAFGDHHHYEQKDLYRIAATAKATGAELLITTVKDWVKIEHAHPWPMVVVAVDVCIGWAGDQEPIGNFLSRALYPPAI